MKIQRYYLYKILLIFFSLIVIISFLLPTVHIVWSFPGEDAVGNLIIFDISESFSILQLISKFAYWISIWTIIFPLMYLVFVLIYAVLFVLKSLNFPISTKILKIMLIYPLIVSLFSLNFFTIFGLGVLISQIACLILLSINPSLVFLNLRKQNQTT